MKLFISALGFLKKKKKKLTSYLQERLPLLSPKSWSLGIGQGIVLNLHKHLNEKFQLKVLCDG